MLKKISALVAMLTLALGLVAVKPAYGATALANYTLPGQAQDLVLGEGDDSDHAFVAMGVDGLEVVNVSNPSDPQLVGYLDTAGVTKKVVYQDQHVYLANGVGGVSVVNVSDPTRPMLVAEVDVEGKALNVTYDNGYLYVSNGRNGVTLINVTDPAMPWIVSNIKTDGIVRAVQVSGTMAYVANGPKGVQVLDYTDVAQPKLVTDYDIPGQAWNLLLHENHLIVAEGARGLEFLDVTTLSNLTRMGSIKLNGFVKDMAMNPDGTQVLASALLQGVKVVNMTNPSNPTLVTSIGITGTARGIEVSMQNPAQLYVAATPVDLQVFSL